MHRLTPPQMMRMWLVPLKTLRRCMGIITPGKISFYNQPPNSPNLNILDLGLFYAMQAAYWNHSPKNSIDIIKMVEKTYNKYSPNKTNSRVFVTLQTIFDTIIKVTISLRSLTL
jgi:hypothetical protein